MSDTGTPRRSIRVADETWERWQAAVRDGGLDARDVTELIHFGVESYLDPKRELAEARDRLKIAATVIAKLSRLAVEGVEVAAAAREALAALAKK